MGADTTLDSVDDVDLEEEDWEEEKDEVEGDGVNGDEADDPCGKASVVCEPLGVDSDDNDAAEIASEERDAK